MNQKITFFPTFYQIEALHDTVITQDVQPQTVIRGHSAKTLVQGTLDWAMTGIYDYNPFPSILKKAAAIMYGYITFHPYNDGNKRTGLVSTSFFLHLNGYTFNIPSYAPDFAKDLASKSITDNPPDIEIPRIAKWLHSHVSQTFIDRARYGYSAKKALKLGYFGDVFDDTKFRSMVWSTTSWFNSTLNTLDMLRQLSKQKNIK